MELLSYHDNDNRVHAAVIIKEGRKWMSVMLVKAGKLKTVRRPVSDKRYMKPSPTKPRKALASIRRLARKPGTSKAVRAAVKGMS